MLRNLKVASKPTESACAGYRIEAVSRIMLTRVAPSRLPVEEFQRRLYQICGVFQAEPVRGRDMLTGGILLEDRAGFEMAHVAKDLQTVRRTRRDIRKDSGENYFLIVQEEGRAMMSQREGARKCCNPAT